MRRQQNPMQTLPGRPPLWVNVVAVLGCFFAIFLIWRTNLTPPTDRTLLLVSTQSTERVFAALNARFEKEEFGQNGLRVHITGSHGGNVIQTTRVMSGEIEPDVVSMGLPSSVDQMRKANLVADDWETRPPGGAGAWYTTMVFLVRRGNPLQLRDWPDLVKMGVGLLVPDPAVMTQGQTSVIAAWGAVRASGGSADDAEDFIRRLFRHTLYRVEDSRTLERIFVEEGEADVLLLREHDALALRDAHPRDFEVVYPPVSLLVESGVTWVDAHTQRHGTTALAKRYLEFLFSAGAQEIMARYGFRPTSDEVFAAHHARFPHIELFPISRVAPSWSAAVQKFFGSGGLAEILYETEVRKALPPATLESEGNALRLTDRESPDGR